MSAKTRADRLNEVADQLLELLKEYVRYDFKKGDSCPNWPSVACDCASCDACKLIEYVDGKSLTL